MIDSADAYFEMLFQQADKGTISQPFTSVPPVPTEGEPDHLKEGEDGQENEQDGGSIFSEGEPDHLLGGEDNPSAKEEDGEVDIPRLIEIISRMETRGETDPATATNSEEGSTATGIFQFTEDTWNRLMTFDDTLPSFQDMPNDPEAQKQGVELLSLLNQTALRKTLKSEPSMSNLLLAHRFGLGAATRLIMSDPLTPLDEVLHPHKVIFHNKDLHDIKTTGELLEKFEGLTL